MSALTPLPSTGRLRTEYNVANFCDVCTTLQFYHTPHTGLSTISRSTSHTAVAALTPANL